MPSLQAYRCTPHLGTCLAQPTPSGAENGAARTTAVEVEPLIRGDDSDVAPELHNAAVVQHQPSGWGELEAERQGSPRCGGGLRRHVRHAPQLHQGAQQSRRCPQSMVAADRTSCR